MEDGDDITGTIDSFDGTTLVINEFNDGTVSGMVTDQTEIKCENEDMDGGDGGGDNKLARDGGGGNTCTTADLVRGAVVSEAELDDTGTVFEKVELGQSGDED